MEKDRKRHKLLKVAVITNKESLYGRMILNELLKLDQKVDATIVIRQPLNYYLKLFKSVYKRVGFDVFLFSARRLFHNIFRKKPTDWKGNFIYQFEKLSKKVVFTNGANSSQTISLIRKFKPDLLIVGQTGILKKDILKLPKIGILNGHPGLLPYYRGIDCAMWAIYNGEFNKIGSSVHWVDLKVDTGRIISTKRYKLKDGDSIDFLEEKLFTICSTMIANVVKTLRFGKKLKGRAQKLSSGEQYYKMSKRLEKITQQKLEKFLSNEKHS